MKRTIIFGIILAAALAPFIVQAQSDLLRQTEAFAGEEGAGFVSRESESGLVPEDPRYLIGLIIRVAVSLLGMGMIAYLVYGGYLIMTGGGVEERVKKGQKTIFTALIGAVVILMAYAITRYIFTIATGGGGALESGLRVRVEEDTSRPRDVLAEP